MKSAMTMKDVFGLQADELKAYYDVCISTLQKLTECEKEIKKNDLKVKKNESLILSRIQILSIVAFLVMIIDCILVCLLVDGTFHYSLLGIIIAVVLVFAGILFVYFLFKSREIEEYFVRENKKISDKIVNLNRQTSELQETIERIKVSIQYKNMMLVFDDALVLEYMKALRKIISTGRACKHEEAVKIYNADVKLEKDRQLKEQLVYAEQEKARGLNRISSSQSELASSINSLSEKVSELNIKCEHGAAAKEDVSGVLEAASSCSSLVFNLVELMKMFI